ncbi:MAG: 7-cyano-7-deazaguanine synthase QueC [Candidatus Eisenbacteria bacterium]|nr:7-cyano-7-deazaguanine synthase QueC [Candidatus Eisenbacteria bacterium]MCC7143631.1 7-cyano-7-deazaguanine synthase QueC [Candidatus Eisenbacteria bacterium]
MQNRRAICLLSGGLDSAVALAVARRDGYECFALSVRYGQRHSVELECAALVARALGAARHQIIDLDLSAFGGSSLLSGGADVPKGRDVATGAEGIPSTYVPARNTVFLALALGWAEAAGADAIYLGVNAVDYSGYPDCRPEYLEAFFQLGRLATRRGVEGSPVRLEAPLLRLTKAEIIRLGLDLGVDFGLTSSCYDPSADGRPCGTCDSCSIRTRGFAAIGLRDPRLGP